MGTIKKQNKTTFVRISKDEHHPFNRVPAKLYDLDGYQLAIMAQILSNKDDWKIVKYEIAKRVGFPRQKFNAAWNLLIESGYIKIKRIQSGYDYTIYEDISLTSTTGGICEYSTSTTGTTCAGGTLTTTNTNYNRDMTTTAGSTYDDSQFDELLAAYPSQGTKPDGTTYQLKGKRHDCKRAYSEYLHSGGMTHDEILTALKVELNDRQMTGNTHYQQGLFRWIEDRSFEQYKGRIVEPAKVSYGQNFI